MNVEQYREKYGYAAVMGVERSVVRDFQKDGFTHRRNAVLLEGENVVTLMDWVQRHMKPMPRCEAECNPDFKQVIPYVLIEHRPTGRIFMTTRIGGDDRLVGQHSIGLGGHVDAGEGVADCLYRELNEEIGLAKDDIAELAFCGFIFKEDNEVDSVHLGMVFHAQMDRGDVACLEKEKLTGGWFTRSELLEARENGHMESWSTLCFDQLLREEGAQ